MFDRYYIIAETLNTMRMNHKIQIADIGALEKQEQQSIALRQALYSGSKAIDVANYHTYEEVNNDTRIKEGRFMLLAALDLMVQ